MCALGSPLSPPTEPPAPPRAHISGPPTTWIAPAEPPRVLSVCSATQPPRSPSEMPVDFSGYWKMLANHNFEEYLRALGKRPPSCQEPASGPRGQGGQGGLAGWLWTNLMSRAGLHALVSVSEGLTQGQKTLLAESRGTHGCCPQGQPGAAAGHPPGIAWHGLLGVFRIFLPTSLPLSAALPPLQMSTWPCARSPAC